MKIKTYSRALDYLDSFITSVVFKKIENPAFDPLERMRTLLKLLGNPEKKFKSIVVTGTSGKGSTAYLISHILSSAGYKTGLTISPHLQKVNERLQINGKQISDKEFTRMIASMIRIIEAMKKTKIGAPSYFEILLAMAFKYFAEQKIDIAVVEVGLEGKYDATNVLLPQLTVLTNISLDHTQILGDTVEKIAGEAVFAIKRIKDKGLINNSSFIINHSVVVSGVSQKSVLDIVQKRCWEVNAKLLLLGKDLPAGRQGFNFKIKKVSLEGSVFDLTTTSGRVQWLNDLQLSLIGKYQVENASLAVQAVLELRELGFKITDEVIRKALQTAFFPGRFEVINIARGPVARFPPTSAPSSILRNDEVRAVGSPSSRTTPRNYTLDAKRYTLVLDGAHNPAKMQAFIKELKRFYPKHPPAGGKVFVVAFKEDKNIKEMLEEIIPVANVIIFTKFSTKTDSKVKASMGMAGIKYYVERNKYKKKVEIIYEENSKKALEKALAIQQFNNSAIVVVTGSLYLVGEIRSML